MLCAWIERWRRCDGLRRIAAVAVGATVAVLVPGCDRAGARAVMPRVDFNRQVRPILTQNCIGCHGGVKSASGISFVFREEALKAGASGRIAIVPGQPDKSELIARITSQDPSYRMPKGTGTPLTPAQIAVLRQWIAEGAEWQPHWAFVAPQRPAIPAVRDTQWPRGSVDRFVLARLEREHLQPTPPADRPALLRRVSFDLIGLPPTPEEVAAFVADPAPDAFEKQVDRLLASPHFGERWAAVWLDLARYADSKGYEKDLERSVWKYRDWLIDALNRNEPYDQFVVDQLAGDLLPKATLENIIATSFHRQTQTNDEGGSDDEEFRLYAVEDRIATTWSAFNGLTFNCAQCHSHPYDPIRQSDYYAFLAFFNSTRDADYPNDYPLAYVPDDPKRYGEAQNLATTIAELRERIVARGKQLENDATQWKRLPIVEARGDPEVDIACRDGEAFVDGAVTTKAVYELLTAPATEQTEIRALKVEVPPLNETAARTTPEPGFVVARIDTSVVPASGAEHKVGFVRFCADSENVPDSYPAPLPPGKSAGTSVSSRFMANPMLSRPRWIVGIPTEPLRLHPGDRIKIRLNHGIPITGNPAPVRRVRLATSAAEAWTQLGKDRTLDEDQRRLAAATQELVSIPGTSVPVMQELPDDEARETHLFVRGNWLAKDEKLVRPGLPPFLPPLPSGAPLNRLTLARWFVSPGQPLTARVAVNRYWEQLFGRGLVESMDDFGSTGEPPAHPELLDWLAVHFEQDLRWNAKALLRELALSATYRQSSAASVAAYVRDPHNRLLGRGPRNRLTAEMIRDQALAVSGLLSSKIGGPPVMPPQPPGIWATVYNKVDWVNSEGEDRYRRGIYTYWRRSSPYPSFLTFDVPNRTLCSARRIPTNTPMQALVTLNDPVYREAAVALGRRMKSAGDAIEAQIAFGFCAAIARPPSSNELAELAKLYRTALESPASDAACERPGDDRGDAARGIVAEAILNLDAALTK